MANVEANCHVTFAGPLDDGTILVGLREVDGKFEQNFSADPNVRNQVLATALAALSSGQRVYVQLKELKEGSPIDRIYLLPTK